MYEIVLEKLMRPDRMLGRAEVLTRPCPLPKEPGVYGWFFRGVPPGVLPQGSHRVGDLTLLYIGISPCRPAQFPETGSRQSVRTRVRYHFRGNAYGSTLRLSLGCLLQQTLGIELRRVGRGKRLTFGPGEKLLSDWMAENAFVVWAAVPEPWTIERRLIFSIPVPLDIDHNAHHPFSSKLSAVRRAAKERARGLPMGHAAGS